MKNRGVVFHTSLKCGKLKIYFLDIIKYVEIYRQGCTCGASGSVSKIISRKPKVFKNYSRHDSLRSKEAPLHGRSRFGTRRS